MLDKKRREKLVRQIATSLPNALTEAQADWWSDKDNEKYLASFLEGLAVIVVLSGAKNGTQQTIRVG